jgi:drug/metabolite transporter (DMT)-like permease
MQRAIVRAMPWVFVVIWATGFVVARLAMPHSPPFKFLAVRIALSAACYVVWVALARAAWPRERMQWAHLAVTGTRTCVAVLPLVPMTSTRPGHAGCPS